MKWILPLSLLVIFELIADILAKQWSLKSGYALAIGALLAYLVANTFWLFALRNGSGLGRGAIIFSVASAIIAVLLGLFLFKEPVTKLQAVGFVMGLAAVVLMFWE